MIAKLDKWWADRTPVILVLGFALCAWVAYLTIVPIKNSTDANNSQQRSIDEIFKQSPCLTEPKSALCQETRDNFARTVTPAQVCTFLKTLEAFSGLACDALKPVKAPTARGGGALQSGSSGSQPSGGHRPPLHPPSSVTGTPSGGGGSTPPASPDLICTVT